MTENVFAKRADANQAAIVEALRRAGATVQHLHHIGYGVPDILVGYCGTNFLLEIKNGARSASKLTACQRNWHRQWRGQVKVVRSAGEALQAIGAATLLNYTGGKECSMMKFGQ